MLLLHIFILLINRVHSTCSVCCAKDFKDIFSIPSMNETHRLLCPVCNPFHHLFISFIFSWESALNHLFWQRGTLRSDRSNSSVTMLSKSSKPKIWNIRNPYQCCRISSIKLSFLDFILFSNFFFQFVSLKRQKHVLW